jgi:hypothetical protein
MTGLICPNCEAKCGPRSCPWSAERAVEVYTILSNGAVQFSCDHLLVPEKLREIGANYVESIFQNENEMDIAVLRYLLNDLLPLQEIRMNPDPIIASAIEQKHLPWRLEGTTYRRTGAQVIKKFYGMEGKVSQVLRNFSELLQDIIKEKPFLSFAEIKEKVQDIATVGTPPGKLSLGNKVSELEEKTADDPFHKCHWNKNACARRQGD